MHGCFFQLFKRLTGATISKKIFNGKYLFLYPKCNISSMYMYTHIPDKAEIEHLRSAVVHAERTTFIDVGANVGNYSVSMMDVCNSVIAFEPHPYTAQRCKMNFLLNGVSENNVYEIACSNENGTAYFSDEGGSSTVNSLRKEGPIEVHTLKFDTFAQSHCSIDDEYILKVDVEGFEYEFFLGAHEFLKTYIVRGIVFESFQPTRIIPLLESYGYSVQQINIQNFYATKN